MEAMHSLLKRQLKRHFGDQFKIPAEWRPFLDGVNEAYAAFDADREMLEHSLELSSQEMLDANSEMRAVFQAIPDLVFRLDHQGIILDIKAGATGELTIGRQDSIGKRIQDSLLKEVAPQITDVIHRVIADNAPVCLEYAAVLDGQESDYEARLVPLPGKQIVVIVRNITERKQSLRLLGAAVEQSTESIVITDAELDLPGPRIVFVNPAFTRLTGYTADEVIGKTPRILQGPKSDGSVLRRLRETLGRGETFAGESVNYRKDGTPFNLEWQVTPLYNSCGTITHFLGILRDITVRRQTEEALRTSEKEFRALAEAMPQMVWVTRPDGWNIYFSQQWMDYTGLTLEESLGHGWNKPFHPDDRAQAWLAWQHAVSTIGTYSLECRLRRADGVYRWWLIRGVPMQDASGHVLKWFGTCTDIHELKEKENALQESDEKFRQLADNITDVFWIRSPDMREVHYISPAFERIWGLTRESFYANPQLWTQMIVAEDRERVLGVFAALMADSRSVDTEYRIARPDGEIRWIRVRGFQVRDATDRLVRLAGIVTDITELKHAEERLAHEQERFRFVFESMPVGAALARHFPDGRVERIINDAHLRICGLTREQDRMPGIYRQITLPEDYVRQTELFRQLDGGGTGSLSMEKRYVRLDGEMVWVTFFLQRRQNADGSFDRLTMVVDITARKRIETKLAEASGLLEAMLENSPDLIYFKNRESRFVRVSKGYLLRAGLTGHEMLQGKTDADFYAGDHAQQALADEQEIIRTGQPIVGKLERETYPDGHVTWVLSTKMPWRDGTGAIVGTFGISKDVTALKEAEAKLAYERDQLRALLDAVPDAIYFKDTQSRFVLVSRSKLQDTLNRVPDLRARRALRGLPADVPESELLIGLTDYDTFNDDDARIAHADELQIIRTGKAIIGKLARQTYLDGTARWWLSSKMPWRDGAGQIIGTFGLSKDLTDLKQAEANLEEAHQDLIEASRFAGMAEVATNVLHNVGNLLTSVNVSATLITERTRLSQTANIAKISALLTQHENDLDAFLTGDPKGKKIPAFLGAVATQMALEQNTTLTELDSLRKNIDLIMETVAMQQGFATASRVTETFPLVDVVEESLHVDSNALERDGFELVRDYQVRPTVTVERHKVMQILINLIRNARHACEDCVRPNRQITVRVAGDEDHVRIAIIDNGVGIAPENLVQIFAHGFSTRKDGHGFGLHSAALAATEIGGSLKVQSEGTGHGATFILELPLTPHTPTA